MKKITEEKKIEKNAISARSGRILKFSLPAVSAALAYILFYALSDAARIEQAVSMTEYVLGALVLCVAAAVAADVREEYARRK